MISGFVDPWEPLFVDSNIPKYFKQYKKKLETCLKNITFVNLKMLDIEEMFSGKRRGPEIMNTRLIMFGSIEEVINIFQKT